MKRVLIILSLLLTLGWVFSNFVFRTGPICHGLLLLAILALLRGVILTARPVTERS